MSNSTKYNIIIQRVKGSLVFRSNSRAKDDHVFIAEPPLQWIGDREGRELLERVKSNRKKVVLGLVLLFVHVKVLTLFMRNSNQSVFVIFRSRPPCSRPFYARWSNHRDDSLGRARVPSRRDTEIQSGVSSEHIVTV